jgi:hypothetical protein
MRSAVAVFACSTVAAVGMLLATAQPSTGSNCRPSISGPSAAFRGDLIALAHRVCRPGTARFFVVRLDSPGRRGAAGQRRTVQVTPEQVDKPGELVMAIGAMAPGLYRVTLVTPSGERIHAPRRLSVRRLERSAKPRDCRRARVQPPVPSDLRIHALTAQGVTCATGKRVLRAVAGWADPAQPGDLGASEHPVTLAYRCRVGGDPRTTGPPWSIECQRGSRIITAEAVLHDTTEP